MKKKWLVGLLTFLMVFAMAFGLAACDFIKKDEPEPPASQTDAEIAQTAISAIKLEYTNALGTTPKDFNVWGQTPVGDVTVPVTWTATAKTAGITIGDYVTIGTKDQSTGLVTISITRGEVDIAYTLTAKVTVGEVTQSASFECTIPLLETMAGDASFDFKDVKYDDYKGENYGKLDDASTLAILQAAGGANSSLTAVTATNLYGGTDGTSGGIGGVTDGYLKFGKSAEGGVLSLTFAKPVNKVQVKAQGWKDGSGDTEASNKLDKLSVNGSEEVVPDVTTPTVYTFEIEPATVVNIALTYRGFVFQIDVSFAPEGTHAHTPGTYTHDEGAWTHSTTCTDANCPDPTHKITADCEPVLNVCPVCHYEYEAEEILAKLAADGVLKGTYSLTGMVQEDATESQGDWSFYFEVAGKSIQARYCDHDGLTVLPKAGDTVTVQGPLTVFGTSKTIQFNYGMVTAVSGEGGGTVTPEPTGTFTPITAPAAGKYYFGMQANGTWYYLTGEAVADYEYRLATTTKISEAAEMDLIETDGGYIVKCGEKYLEIVENDSHVNSLYRDQQTAGCVWVWNEQYQIFTVTVNGEAYELGSYNTFYANMSASKLSYLSGTSASSQYPGRFGTYVEGSGEDPTPTPGGDHDDEKYGSATAPLTVSEALALAEEECVVNGDWTAQLVYVTGKVKNNPSVTGSNYYNIYLVDSTDSTKEILVYKIVLKSGVDAPNQNDTLIISGYITRFGYDAGKTDGKIEFSDKDADVVTALENARGTSQVTLGEHDGATVSGLPTEGATNGTTVTFTVEAEQGKEVTAVKVNGEVVEPTAGTSYAFTVAGDAEITVETKGVDEADPTVVATFEFGPKSTDEQQEHYDGKAATAYNETQGKYTLTLTDCTRVYSEAYDAKGNSGLKLGTGSAVASFTFAVPADVTKVVIYVAGYKANAGEITINGGTAQAITTRSNNGEYTPVEINTKTTKSITLATTSNVPRAMIDKIEFWGIASTEPTPGDTTTATFKSSELTYSENTNLTTEMAGEVTLTFSIGTGSNQPIFHQSSKVIRIYNRNTLTVTAPQGNVITKITFAFGDGDGTNDITPDKGTFESPIWTGSTNSVIFTIGGTSGQRRIAQLEIEYKQSTEPEHVHNYTYTYDETTGWQHNGVCNEAGCDQQNITKECVPANNICPDCKHEFTKDEILEKLFAITGKNTVDLEGTYVLTGKVLRIDTAFANEKVTFTMKIDDKEIQCYGEKSTYSSAVKPGDTVTVQGHLKYYYTGVKEFDSGCAITALQAGELTAAEKVAEVQTWLNELPEPVENVITLPTLPDWASGVTLNWECADPAVTIAQDQKTITLTPGTSDVRATVKVTITCGTDSATKEFIVEIPAEGQETVSIDLTNKSNRTSYPDAHNEEVWTQNGITLTHKQSTGSNAVGDYAPIRIYQKHSLEIKFTSAMSKIVFHCNKTSYVTPLKNSIGTMQGVTVTDDGSKTVTVTFTTPTDTFTISSFTASVWLDSVDVVYTSASATVQAPAQVAILSGKEF